jgi:hypothetical protein
LDGNINVDDWKLMGITLNTGSTLAALKMSRFAKFNHQRCICQTNAVDTHKKIKICRPTLDDVQRLSQGQRAKTRGWGSRQVCHRLNEMERKAFDLAKDRGYLTIRGTGYRKERKGSPLANIYRQMCDANAQHCVVVENLPGGQMDCVLVDLSTLRCAHDPITRQVGTVNAMDILSVSFSTLERIISH